MENFSNIWCAKVEWLFMLTMDVYSKEVLDSQKDIYTEMQLQMMTFSEVFILVQIHINWHAP